MNTLVYADVDEQQASSASSIASTVQQMFRQFRGGCGVAGHGVLSFPIATLPAPRNLFTASIGAFLVLGAMTILSTIVFRELKTRRRRRR